MEPLTTSARVTLLEEMILSRLTDAEIILNFAQEGPSFWDADEEEIQININLARERIAANPNAMAEFLARKLALDKDWKGVAAMESKMVPTTPFRTGLHIGKSTAELLGL